MPGSPSTARVTDRPAPDKPVPLGRVAGPWGVRGWVRVVPYGDTPDGLMAQGTWWIAEASGAWGRFAVRETKLHSGTVLASLEGIDDPERARTFAGRDVAVARDALPKAKRGEVYLADLAGLAVVSTTGSKLGTVAGIEEFGGHPLLRVVDGELERLVPCVAPIVVAIDVKGGTIEVDWEADY